MFPSISPQRAVLLLGLVLGLLFFRLSPTQAQTAPHPEPQRPAASAPAPADSPASHLPANGAPGDAAHGWLNDLLLGLVVVLVAAKLGGELMERLGQPAVLGEILAGILLGNAALVGLKQLAFLHGNVPLEALGELGVIILLFEVGLESNIAEMRQVGLSSLLVATVGVVVPMALGFGVARVFIPQAPLLAWVFVGATLCATSVGITARVLRDLGQLRRAESKIVLGAAVIDDVMGLVVLAVVGGIISAVGSGQTLGLGGIVWIVLKATLFLVGSIAIGSYLSPRLFRSASLLNVRHMLLVTAFAFCLLLARLAAEIGLAPIVGAFAAGLILDPVHYQEFRDRGEHTIEELIHPIGGLLVPVFFVLTGMKVDLQALGNPGVLGFAAALTVAAIVGKQVCGLAVVERGLDRLSVGIGMIPRGEVGLIFANVGRTLVLAGAPVVSAGTFSAVVIMVMVSTLITPPLLKWSFLRSGTPAGEPASLA